MCQNPVGSRMFKLIHYYIICRNMLVVHTCAAWQTHIWRLPGRTVHAIVPRGFYAHANFLQSYANRK